MTIRKELRKPLRKGGKAPVIHKKHQHKAKKKHPEAQKEKAASLATKSEALSPKKPKKQHSSKTRHYAPCKKIHAKKSEGLSDSAHATTIEEPSHKQKGRKKLFSSPTIVYPTINLNGLQILQEIFGALRSGQREVWKKSHPALPHLLKHALVTGKASTLVSVQDKIYRAIIKKKEDGSFSMNYTQPCITEEELKLAKLSDEDAQYLQTHSDKLIQFLFSCSVPVTAGGGKIELPA